MHKIVDRTDYFSAAIDVLAEADHGGLKLTPLCRRLQVTTGSFYHYFGSWARFKTELLESWLNDRTLNLANTARRLDDPQLSLNTLVEMACDLPTALKQPSAPGPTVTRRSVRFNPPSTNSATRSPMTPCCACTATRTRPRPSRGSPPSS